MRRTKFSLAIIAGLLAVGLTAPVSAAPISASAAAALQSSTSAVEKVHVRRYRHCHGPRGHRWCHGGYYGSVVGMAAITPTTVQVSISTSVLVTGTVATAATMAVIEDITATKLE